MSIQQRLTIEVSFNCLNDAGVKYKGKNIGGFFWVFDAVPLKPLENAIRDNDNIYSVICGSALNSCGRGPSLTYSGEEAQQQVYRDAFDSAPGRSPADVCFAEFHGTGIRKFSNHI